MVKPPLFYRLLFPNGIWRKKLPGRKVAYITFDDGPIPEVTPRILDILDSFGVKATFFVVGDNAHKFPDLMQEIIHRGHTIGNHTMHHLRGLHTKTDTYVSDVNQANELLHSALFRPPHGLLKWGQIRRLRASYKLVMYDVVTRDYDKEISFQEVLNNVIRFTRNGSIIVFHDSIKTQHCTLQALPHAITWLQTNGYELLPL